MGGAMWAGALPTPITSTAAPPSPIHSERAPCADLPAPAGLIILPPFSWGRPMLTSPLQNIRDRVITVTNSWLARTLLVATTLLWTQLATAGSILFIGNSFD